MQEKLFSFFLSVVGFSMENYRMHFPSSDCIIWIYFYIAPRKQNSIVFIAWFDYDFLIYSLGVHVMLQPPPFFPLLWKQWQQQGEREATAVAPVISLDDGLTFLKSATRFGMWPWQPQKPFGGKRYRSYFYRYYCLLQPIKFDYTVWIQKQSLWHWLQPPFEIFYVNMCN